MKTFRKENRTQAAELGTGGHEFRWKGSTKPIWFEVAELEVVERFNVVDFNPFDTPEGEFTTVTPEKELQESRTIGGKATCEERKTIEFSKETERDSGIFETRGRIAEFAFSFRRITNKEAETISRGTLFPHSSNPEVYSSGGFELPLPEDAFDLLEKRIRAGEAGSVSVCVLLDSFENELDASFAEPEHHRNFVVLGEHASTAISSISVSTRKLAIEKQENDADLWPNDEDDYLDADTTESELFVDWSKKYNSLGISGNWADVGMHYLFVVMPIALAVVYCVLESELVAAAIVFVALVIARGNSSLRSGQQHLGILALQVFAGIGSSIEYRDTQRAKARDNQ